MKVVKIVSPTHLPPLLPGKIPGTPGPSAAGRMKSKIEVTPSGIDPATLRLASAVPQPTAPPRHH